MTHPFFKCQGPIKVSKILKYLNININNLNKDNEIRDIKDLNFSHHLIGVFPPMPER